MAIPRLALPRIGNLLAFLLLLLVNGLIFFLRLGNNVIGADARTPLDPDFASLVVWIPIYGFMLLFVIHQLLPYTYKYDYINRGITPYFAAHCVVNIAWTLAQVYATNTSRFVELIFLYFILLCLAISYSTVWFIVARDLRHETGSNDHYYLHFIFGRAWLSMYFAWIVCSAFTVSFSSLTSLDDAAYRDAAITFAAIGVLALIILGVLHDVLFGSVVLWAAICLAISNRSSREGVEAGLQHPVFASAVSVACFVALVNSITFVKNIIFLFSRFKMLRIIKKEESA